MTDVHGDPPGVDEGSGPGASAARSLAVQPLVSIVIPAYNHEQFVVQCLDSVLGADYPNKEIIVIDDGSTDGTLAAVTSWAGRNGGIIPIVVSSRPNRGATRTLNELLRQVRGKFVVPMASDDYLLPNGIRTLVSALDRRPDVKAVFGDAVVVDALGARLHNSALFEYWHANRSRLQHHLAHEIITNFAVAGPTIMYRPAPIIAMGGYDETLCVEDWDFHLRLVARGWLHYVDETVAAYRLHGGNAHMNPETLMQRRDERRRVALRAARSFRGGARLLLLARAAYLHPWIGGTPGQAGSRARRTLKSFLKRAARLVRAG